MPGGRRLGFVSLQRPRAVQPAVGGRRNRAALGERNRPIAYSASRHGYARAVRRGTGPNRLLRQRRRLTVPADLHRASGWHGTDVRHLVVSDANDLEPDLSPDGTMVGFSRGPALFVVKVDGTGLKQIDQASCGSSCASDDMGGWSPDGTQIVFWRGLSDATGKVVNAGIWVMNADGSGTHQVTLRNVIVPMQDDDPNWSPDGKRLVFQRDRYTTPETYAIFTVAIDGSDLRQVTPWALSAANPAWSPDGTLIAFNTPAEQAPFVEQHIDVIHPDGTGLTQLTSGMSVSPDGTEASNHPSWSPDGSQIVFAHRPGTTGPLPDLYVMNRDGSDLHVLAGTPLRENGPNWGPAPTK